MAKITPISRSPRLAVVSRKERLFEDFFINMLKTTERIENLFGVRGVKEQVFGCDHSFGDPDEGQAKESLRNNRAWLLASELYDYAVEGIDRTGQSGSVSDGASSLVIDAGEIIALLTGEEDAPLNAWHDVVMMGDARVALHDDLGIRVESLALLANVDVRTVRNAISSGALLCNKEDDPYIGSDSARLWLMGRKGFKATAFASETSLNIAEVETAERFGALLKQRRADRDLGLTPAQEPSLVAYPGLTKEILAEAEAGVFRVPLSVVWPLADYYGIARDELLDCVMRVFFPDELEALSSRLQRSRLSLVATANPNGSV